MIDATKGDRTPARIVESLQERQDTTLSRAGGSAEGVGFAGADPKANVLEGGMIRTLRVAHLDMVPVAPHNSVSLGQAMLRTAEAYKTMSPDAQSCSISPADAGAV